MDKPLAQRGISVHLPTPYKSCRYPSSRITKMTRLAKGAKSHQSFTPAVKSVYIVFSRTCASSSCVNVCDMYVESIYHISHLLQCNEYHFSTPLRRHTTCNTSSFTLHLRLKCIFYYGHKHMLTCTGVSESLAQ